MVILHHDKPREYIVSKVIVMSVITNIQCILQILINIGYFLGSHNIYIIYNLRFSHTIKVYVEIALELYMHD